MYRSRTCFAMPLSGLAVALGVMASVPARADDKTVIYATDAWPPYILGNVEQEATGGLFVDYLRELMGRLGYGLKVPIVPAARGMAMIKSGASDITGPMMENAERKEWGVYSIPLYAQPLVFYALADRQPAFDWKDFKDLKSYTVGLINGSYFGAELEKAITEDGLDIVRTASHGDNARMVIAKRLDAMGGNLVVIKGVLDGNPDWKGKLVAHPKPFGQALYHIVLGKKSWLAADIDRLNQAIAATKEDGTLKRLMEIE